jgi:hypothetical protein
MKILLVVMGVSGSGKSTLCRKIYDVLCANSRRLVFFLEGDDFHSPANKLKMAQGKPLDEDDRKTWLGALIGTAAVRLREANADGAQPPVILVACSALRKDETTPLHHPEHYAYDFELADIAELWRRGSVIGSWLLDLTAQALHKDASLAGFKGEVSDSGEGRWTLMAAIDEAVPAPVLSAAVYARFSSRGQGDFADKMLSALRYEFGGHAEK